MNRRSRPRRSKILTALALALVAFVGGRLLGGSVIDRPEVSLPASDPVTVRTGYRIPDAVLQSAEARPVTVRSLAMRDTTPLVLVAMTEGCQSCDDDTPRWEALAEAEGARVRFVQLVCAVDFTQAERTRSLRGFDARYLCDDLLRKSWNLNRLPAAIVLNSTGLVQFVDMGGPAARLTADYLEASQ